MGITMVNLTPMNVKTPILEPAIVIKYFDGEVIWFKRLVETQLWLYRVAGAAETGGEQELSSIIDAKKWIKRKNNVEKKSAVTAMNLIKSMAMRNALHRTPYIENNRKYKDFESRFAFTPSIDQIECFRSIEDDMVNKTRPMDRLVCGDVGFGKTEVAMRAIYRAVLSNKQVALLAPTRVLAQQHLRVLRNRMPDIRIDILRGRSKPEAHTIKEEIQNGKCQVVVGTHALLHPSVRFQRLGLLIVDEEQRFGVLQKEKLKLNYLNNNAAAYNNSTSTAYSTNVKVDVLTLSATPIPRTLQMSLNGLRDLSLITSPPAGRLEVLVTVSMYDEDVMVQAITKEVDRGGQVFVVVPFVMDVQPVATRLSSLLEGACNGEGVGIIQAHGQHDDLETRIDAFSNGEAGILVATTVIENGVDMPNVNTIIVLNADRFGMSAMYQLRGRVGRSTRQAYAYFMTNKTSVTVEAETRLTYIKTFTALGSGYDLSRRDMEMRGSGTIFGSDQSGSRDVGLDLQSVILQQSLDNLRNEFILSVPDTSVAIGTKLISLCEPSIGPMPTALARDNVNTTDADLIETSELIQQQQVARWESSLATFILSKVFQSSAKHGKVDGNSVLLESVIEEASQSYFSCGSAEDFLSLRKQWGKLFSPQKVPSILIELIKRSVIRIAARRLGVHFITSKKSKSMKTIDNTDTLQAIDICFYSNEINDLKWRNISSSIPEEFVSRVHFEELRVVSSIGDNVINSNRNIDEKSMSMGVITFTHYSNITRNSNSNDVDDNGGCLLPLIPVEAVQLVMALAKSAENNLNEALQSFEVKATSSSSSEDQDEEEEDEEKSE